MNAKLYTNELRIEFWRILEANELKKTLQKYKGKSIPTNVFLSELDRTCDRPRLPCNCVLDAENGINAALRPVPRCRF